MDIYDAISNHNQIIYDVRALQNALAECEVDVSDIITILQNDLRKNAEYLCSQFNN